MMYRCAIAKEQNLLAQLQEQEQAIKRLKKQLQAAEATNKAVVKDKKRIQKWARRMKDDYSIEEEIPDDCC